MSLLLRFLRSMGEPTVRRVSPGVVASGPPIPGAQRSVVVSRRGRPLFEERGWVLRRGTLVGKFVTPQGLFPGRIEGALGAQPVYLVERPAPAVLDGPHGPCFRPVSNGVYRVHWNRSPPSLDAGIAAIEGLFTESLS